MKVSITFMGVKDGGLLYIEVFEWRSGEAAGIAHSTPEVMAVWEPMGKCVEARDGRPQFEFPHMWRHPLADA